MKKIIFYLIPNRRLHLSVLVLSTSLSGTCHIRHLTIWFYKWQLSCQIYCPRYYMLLCGLAKLVMLKKTFWFAFYSMHMGCFLATFQQAAGSWKALQRASAEKSWRSRGIIHLRCSWSSIRSTRFQNFFQDLLQFACWHQHSPDTGQRLTRFARAEDSHRGQVHLQLPPPANNLL